MPGRLPPPAETDVAADRSGRDPGLGRPVVLVAVAGAVALLLGFVVAPMASARFAPPAVDAARVAPSDAAVLKTSGAKPAARPTAKPTVTPSAAATPKATAATTPEPAAAATTDPSAPVPATPERKARNVPADPPAGSGTGRRIVYDKALMTVWIVDSHNRTVRRYPVVGRWDRPAKGTYHIYSKSTDSMNEHSKVTFKYMVRFAWGTRTDASIGFHTIPVYYEDHDGHAAGTRMHGTDELGLPIAAGGCVRQRDEDAEFLYRWSEVGDTVVVLPSP